MIISHEGQQRYFRESELARQLSHAYILSGSEGIGKKKFAKELARGLICPEKKLFQPCNCPTCKQVMQNSHPDYYLFEAKDDLKIENIRGVSEISELTAYGQGWKVIILDNAHILCHGGADAANALLKTLEEPGPNTIFLLITDKLNKILPTIQSRCIIVTFEPLDDKALLRISSENDLGIDDVIRYADGSVSKALLMKEINAEALDKSLSSNDAAATGQLFLGISSRQHFAGVLMIMRNHFFYRYKINANPDIMIFIQYLDQSLKNLDYNVNLSLVIMDAYVKLSEALDAISAGS